MNDLPAYCLELARRAKAAAAELAQAGGGQKQRWLRAAARLLGERSAALAEANGLDLAAAAGSGLGEAQIDRLRLRRRGLRPCRRPGTGGRPAGTDRRGDLLVDSPQRAGGAKGSRAAGGDLFHLRVAAERDHRRGGICIKSGNAVILRGGKEAAHSNAALAEILAAAAVETGLPPAPCSWWPRRTGPPWDICCTCPSISTSPFPAAARRLIRRVSQEALMPVIKHYAGNCHVYLDRSADPEMAEKLVVNAKCQRMGVCNAAESLVVHAEAAASLLPRLGKALAGAASRSAATERTRQFLPQAKPASEEDYRTEYLGPVISVQGGRFAGRGDPAHQRVRLAAYRGHRHPRPGGGPAVRRPHRQFRR